VEARQMFKRICLTVLALTTVSSALYATQVGAPPSELGLNEFYAKYIDESGIPIISSAKVSDEALVAAAAIVKGMMMDRPDLYEPLISQKVKVAVMASTEVTSDIPEHSDLNRVFPKWNWDTRCRGVGATHARPVCSCAEENLLQLPQDKYIKENILVHEFAHTVVNLGVLRVDRRFGARLKEAYASAMKEHLWENTYAATDWEEYWAEGAQDWFDCNLYRARTDGNHNQIHTQEQLRRYDPRLAELLGEVFPSYLQWDGRTLVPRRS
jgi:hypothetical protein